MCENTQCPCFVHVVLQHNVVSVAFDLAFDLNRPTLFFIKNFNENKLYTNVEA